MDVLSILISCEHAGNQVPVRYRSLFDSEEILSSTLGWEDGALDMAVALSETLDAPCFTHQTTRLLVDVNHSLGHAQLFSAFSKPLGDEDKQLLLDKYYFPYRLRVENALAMLPKPVVHLSIHTFAPAQNEKIYLTDVGLVFNPNRTLENTLAEKIIPALKKEVPTLRMELHEPYQGIEDSFLQYLRTRFSEEEYAGIEIAINQKIMLTEEIEKLLTALRTSLLALRA